MIGITPPTTALYHLRVNVNDALSHTLNGVAYARLYTHHDGGDASCLDVET